MGETASFSSAKLIMGVIASRDYPPGVIIPVLVDNFGQTDYIGETVPFDFTDYYTAEMGGELYRFFVSFRDLVCPSTLAGFKHLSNKLESRFARNNRRPVNLDPGILTLHSLILASTKDHSHRIPLSGGIYGEVTLLYEKGGFRDLPWTYPDYRTEGYKADFTKIRTLFHEQLKQKG